MITREEAAKRLERLTKMTLLPGDDDPHKTAEALFMAINELKKDGSVDPDLNLIDKKQFVSRLVDARDIIKAICYVNHRNDDFEHPIVNVIDMMISLIQHQEVVKTK